MLAVYVALVYALNFIAGEGGLLSFCFGGIWGIGAYATTLAMIGRSGLPYVDALAVTGAYGLEVAIPIAAAAGLAAALLAAAASLRFRGDSFILATLAVQTLLISALSNANSLTRGASGLYAIPAPVLFGETFGSLGSYAIFAGLVAASMSVGLMLLRPTRFGLSLRALRDSERRATSLGIAPNMTYALAFALAGAVAGVAGALYVGRVSYIDPTAFAMPESIVLVTALLVGGRGTRLGPLVGAAVLTIVPELLRFVASTSQEAASWRNVILGGLLVMLMFLRPQGLAGEKLR
jgi:branched-chain amino acid transport system permease protein